MRRGGFEAEDSSDMKQHMHKVNEDSSEGQQEELDRKNLFTDTLIDLADKSYPFMFAAGDYGSVVNPDDPKDEGHPVHPHDRGVQLVLMDGDWLGARIMEFKAAGQSDAAAKRHAGENAFTSFVMMMSRVIEDFVLASQQWGCPEKSAVEVAVVLLIDAMNEARSKGIPSSVIKLWVAPAMLAMLDKSDIEELTEHMKSKIDEKLGGKQKE